MLIAVGDMLNLAIFAPILLLIGSIFGLNFSNKYFDNLHCRLLHFRHQSFKYQNTINQLGS